MCVNIEVTRNYTKFGVSLPDLLARFSLSDLATVANFCGEEKSI